LLPLPDTTTATRRNIVRKYKLSEFPDPRPFLHIRCGDDILDTLVEAGIPGDGIRWADVLCEGPLHHHANEEHFRKERAAYISARYQIPLSETYREILGADWRVDQCVRYDETVLWFEADLFDQVILVYLLARLSRFAAEAKISLICIGSFPGVRRFIGLGQLGPAQLATLLPQRRPVTGKQFDFARVAWEAFNADSPRALVRLAKSRSGVLPYLPRAIRRYLAEYPSTVNGLSQTGQRALEAFAAGAETPVEAFFRVQRRESRPFLGDTMFYAVIRDLAAGDEPALEGEHPRLARLRFSELRRCRVRLSETGRKLLAGQADWCRIAGVGRSIGGVHLRGAAPRWRWDPARGRLVERRPK
jgi:uncharacterized protein DUF1835